MIEEAGGTLPGDPIGPTPDPDLEDEALAAEARARYRTDGISTIEPDGSIRSALWAGEKVLAFRPGASIEHLSQRTAVPVMGPLAVTTERLLFIDGAPMTLAALEELDDVTVSTDRLMVMLTSGSGFAISAPQPRLLRVQLAEARASRLDGQTVASSRGTSEKPRDSR
jgi:hypothetical protein